MQYLTKDELKRVFNVSYEHNKLHHLCMLVGFWHGLRVSEVIGIRGKDVADGLLSVKRLKKSKSTLQPVHKDDDKVLDESNLLVYAGNTPGKLFPFSRQRVDQFFKRYCRLAGIHPSKAHFHVLKHSIAMALFEGAKSLGQVQSYLGHKAASSTLCYLYESDATKAQKVVEEMKL